MIVYIHYPTETTFDTFSEADEYVLAHGGYIIERELSEDEYLDELPFDSMSPAQQVKVLTKYGY